MTFHSSVQFCLYFRNNIFSSSSLNCLTHSPTTSFLSASAAPIFLSVLLITTDLFLLIFNQVKADYFLRLDRFCTLFTPVLISKNVQSVLGTFQQKIVLKTSSRAHVQTFGVARWRLGDFSTKKNILLFVLLWKSFWVLKTCFHFGICDFWNNPLCMTVCF